MNKRFTDALVWLVVCGTMPVIGVNTFWYGKACASTETASLSGIKALYGDADAASGRTDASSFELPTQSSPPDGKPTAVKPTATAIRCPDGVTRNALEVLLLVRQANPNLPIWDEPELAQALSGERGIWQWIKDHIKISVDAFGLHFQLVGDGGFCGQVTVMWWDGWNATWEPC